MNITDVTKTKIFFLIILHLVLHCLCRWFYVAWGWSTIAKTCKWLKKRNEVEWLCDKNLKYTWFMTRLMFVNARDKDWGTGCIKHFLETNIEKIQPSGNLTQLINIWFNVADCKY